ncbi:hypothetical protein GWK47_029411 [Chionoecetes opilio]|uniref:Uncharacterized protein n=1 Tax=Chionoecetes opilio TaxID=41210 RepID=A0A8J5CRJ2_CHIOP|nr:hypothetical protein GWK47_029411 [Chionoecetes opilio]
MLRQLAMIREFWHSLHEIWLQLRLTTTSPAIETTHGPQKPQVETDIEDNIEKNEMIRCIFNFIRTDLFLNPRIVPIVDVATDILSSDTFSVDVRDSIKKNLQRTLQREFGESLIFFNVKHRVYLMPENLTKREIAAECVNLKAEVKAFEQTDDESNIVRAATSLRHQIKDAHYNERWPPQPAELTSDYVKIPDSLRVFLHTLICGSGGSSARADTLYGRWLKISSMLYTGVPSEHRSMSYFRGS